MEPKSFTGLARKRTTSRLVLWTDRAARVFITLGGAGTILAVATVCLFLAWTVVPLFLPARFDPVGTVRLSGEGAPAAATLFGRVDEYGSLGWAYRVDGSAAVLRVDTGRVLAVRRPFGGVLPTSSAFAAAEGRAAFGFADGTVRLASVGFTSAFVPGEGAAPALTSLRPGEIAEEGEGIVTRVAGGRLRRAGLRFDLEPPVVVAAGRPVVRLDLTLRGSSPRLAACTADGTLFVEEATTTVNLLTDESVTKVSGGSLLLPGAAERGPPDFVLMGGTGPMAFAAWKDGRCVRVDTRDFESPAVAEVVDLLGDRGRTLTSLGFLIGKTTLVAGDSAGRVRTWFTVRPAGAPTADGAVLVPAHDLPGPAAAVVATAPSERTRLLAAAYADGSVRLFHVTSDRLLGEGRSEGGAAAGSVALSPKDDALLAFGGGSLSRWSIDAPHPETTLHSIFGKVWYEGAERPEHVWQSSSGTDDFEPKYGLMPLIFGTLKATVFSMLFSVPIALLAAVHTSEFLRPEVRARVKPVIELMASLPSVVLGFLAALIFAPIIESRVPAVLASFATVPLAVLAAAHLWQMLPRTAAARWEKRRLLLAAVAVPVGFLAAHLLGGTVERILFDGDVKSWLDGGRGSGAGGWFLLLLPACGLAMAILGPRLPVPARGREAAASAGRCAAGGAGAVLGAWTLASLLAALGFDPRGPVFGTFVQRNALVVGVLMGFAVIPIVYTLAEDALAAVPEHLRAASLAVGATRWQTAVSVILPTAASGLFSACMIGLGRAVGETMVVLMAAGNTPIMEWNPFNGFRTLSANIATELPEAVQGGTNFRMLFLAALCLFAITFALNTAAEVVRQRFRRRAFEL